MRVNFWPFVSSTHIVVDRFDVDVHVVMRHAEDAMRGDANAWWVKGTVLGMGDGVVGCLWRSEEGLPEQVAKYHRHIEKQQVVTGRSGIV